MSSRIAMTALACSLIAACAGGEREGMPDAAQPAGEPGGDGAEVVDCPGVPCDVIQQCGCGEAEACDVADHAITIEDTACRPAGAGTADGLCAAPEDCAAGFTCDQGQCRRWCQADRDCGDRGHCWDWPPEVLGARTCMKACKPEAPAASGCPEGFACRYYLSDPNDVQNDGDEFEYTDCSPAGDGTHGTDCSETGEAGCAQGYGCYRISWTDGSYTRECREICVFTVAGAPADNTCAVGVCNEWLDPGAVIGDLEYGTCW